MKRIEVLCPVFREQEALVGFHERLCEAVKPLRDRYVFGFIYAMDPSPDRTEQVLRELAGRDPDVRVIVMSRRFGHQAALLAGIESADADALIMMDSDGQHPPELISTLLQHWSEGAQIVQTLRRDGGETGWLKRSTSAWFYHALSRIGSIDLKGGAADYRLLDRRVVEVVREDFSERNIFLRGIIAWVGYSTAFVEFEPMKRMSGTSNYRASILINFAIQGISSFSKFPLRLCTLVGMGVAVLSVLAAILMVVDYLMDTQVVPGWATLMAFVSFLGGLQLFFMGVFGEYLGQIFDEVKGRPRYLVARQYGGRKADSARVAAAVEPAHD
jgi:glycosyltransferase involved in cell wall biosynthesis